MRLAPKPIVSARLVEAREAAGLAQHEVATAAEVSQPLVSAWEDPKNPKKPGPRHWEAIAKALGKSIEDLFFVAEDAEPVAAEG